LDLNLIDRVYECAFAPEFWPGVLDEFAKISDARGRHVGGGEPGDVDPPFGTASEKLRENVEQYIRGGFYRRGHATNRLLDFGHVGFIRYDDVITTEEMVSDPRVLSF
jgi:hypothetical protein